MGAFETSILLAPAGPNLWSGEADPDYAHQGGRFGGWTAAALLRAILLEPGVQGEPLATSVLFTDAVGDGPIEIATRLLRSGSRLQFWRSELHQRGKVCAHAQVTMGVRRDSPGFTDAEMPVAPPPEVPGLREGMGGVPFLRQFQSRWVTASPMNLQDQDETARSMQWVRDAHGRPMDHCLLAALADLAPPRVTFKRKTWVTSSTVSMTTHFHALPDELAAVGTDFILSDVQCRRCEGGYFDHELKLWSRDGVLLATSEQVAAFRD